MPVYLITTPESETDAASSNSEGSHLSPLKFRPSSTDALANVAGKRDRVSETDRWVQELLKLTLTPESQKSKSSLERKNTVDVKRHRVFSTRVGVQPRDVRRTLSTRKEKRRSKKCGREDTGEEVSSWIASEIFSIAKTQAAEVDVPIKKVEGSGMTGFELAEDYQDIESLMGEYFEDVKVEGSDCGLE
jgi:hypothetical protein